MFKDKKRVAIGVMSVWISFVFIQSLFFKFSNAPETQHIFNTLDAWANDAFGVSGLFVPPGIFNGYVIGTVELIASLFLLAGLFLGREKLTVIGAFIAFDVITGAILFHLFTPLGVDVQGDGGTLFGMAVSVWFVSAILMWMHRHVILSLLKKDTASA